MSDLREILAECKQRIDEWADSIHKPSRGQMLTHSLLTGWSAGEVEAAKPRDCPYEGYDWKWAWRTGFDLSRRMVPNELCEAAIREHAAALLSPIPERYACQRCGRRDGLDAMASDEVWESLSAAAGGVNLLCLWCMDELAQSLGIKSGVSLHFAGEALHGSWHEKESEQAVRRLFVEAAVAAEKKAAALLARAESAEAELRAARSALAGIKAGMVGSIAEGITDVGVELARCREDLRALRGPKVLNVTG